MSDATMTTTGDETMEAEILPTYQPEKVPRAKLKPFQLDERPTYYDPTAAGDAGPHLRYPHMRSYLTFQRGGVTCTNPLEEEMVRRHLGSNADRFKGGTLVEDAVCACGFRTVNQQAVREHNTYFPDHDIRL